MIDSHCHLDIAVFDADRAQVVARAGARGVHGMLVPAIRPATWPSLAAVGAQFGAHGVRLAFGIHPQIVPELTAGELALTGSQAQFTAALAKADSDAQALGAAPAVAVGECGLDGGTAEFASQEQLFRLQLRAARELRLPVVIHVLRAHHRAPTILREERVWECGGIMHSYSGGPAMLGVYRDLGLVFSFAGPVTYPGSRRPRGAAVECPADALLVETDAPDQAPVPHRGTRCEPGYLPDTLASIAVARGVPADELAAQTVANTLRILPAWRNP